MTGKQLKNSILQWAIQGKLVPQDPNDEPASVLLEKIRAEKARLIKEGKIKKDKKESIIYRGEDNSYYEKFADGKVVCIDDEIPFEVPESWQWERWGNLSYSIQYGYNAPAEEAGDIRMVRISDIQDGEVLWTTVPFCHINKSEIDSYLLQKDDILFARTGGTVGKSFLVNDVPYPSIYAGYLIRTRYSNMLSAQYMKYFMECELYWEQLRTGTIATAQPNCNGKTLAKMILPIPPYNEQIRITDKLNQVLEQVRKYGESQDRLDKLNVQIFDLLKKSILQEAIQGKLVPKNASDEPASILLQRIKEEKLRLVKEGKLKNKDVVESTIYRGDDNKYYEQIGQEIVDITDDVPFDLPDNWQWVRFGQIVRMCIGKTPARGDVKYWSDATKPWVSISDMADYGHINNTKEKISNAAAASIMGGISPVGSLLMSFKLTVGRTSILDIDAYHNEAIISIYPFIDEDFTLRDYLFYTLPVLSNMGDSKDAIKGKTLNSKSLNSLLIPLPPLKEQRYIINRLEELYAHL